MFRYVFKDIIDRKKSLTGGIRIGFIKRLTKKEEPEDLKELRQWQKNTG